MRYFHSKLNIPFYVITKGTEEQQEFIQYLKSKNTKNPHYLTGYGTNTDNFYGINSNWEADYKHSDIWDNENATIYTFKRFQQIINSPKTDYTKNFGLTTPIKTFQTQQEVNIEKMTQEFKKWWEEEKSQQRQCYDNWYQLVEQKIRRINENELYFGKQSTTPVGDILAERAFKDYLKQFVPVQTCPNCGGQKSITYTDFAYATTGGFLTKTFLCKVCEGKGVVPMHKEQ